MTPVTCGVAIEVPDKKTAPSLVLKSADSISEPGARISTQGPKLEKLPEIVINNFELKNIPKFSQQWNILVVFGIARI